MPWGPGLVLLVGPDDWSCRQSRLVVGSDCLEPPAAGTELRSRCCGALIARRAQRMTMQAAGSWQLHICRRGSTCQLSNGLSQHLVPLLCSTMRRAQRMMRGGGEGSSGGGRTPAACWTTPTDRGRMIAHQSGRAAAGQASG